MSGYGISVQVIDRGSPTLAEALRRAPVETTQALRRAVDRSTLLLEREAKERAPKRTGTLQRSIQVSRATTSLHAVEGRVGTNLKYAPFQEYGVKPFGPRNAKVLRFKVGGKWVYAKRVRGFAGRFYFKGAIESAKPRIGKFFEEAVAEITRLLAG